MLSKILNFHRNTKPRTYFFKEGKGAPKSVHKEDVDRLSGISKEDELEAQRARLDEIYKQQTNSRVDLSSSIVPAGSAELANQTSDVGNGEMVGTTKTSEKGDPLAVIGNQESALDSPTNQTSEVATQAPENGQIASDINETMARLAQENEALKQQVSGNAETNEKLQTTIEQLMSQMQQMQQMVNAKLNNQPPNAGMAQEANSNLDSKKAQSIWDKMRKLTPKQIAGGVIAAIGIGVVALYGAPLVLSVVASTHIATGIGIGTWGAAGLATANAAAIAAIPTFSVAQAIATGAVAGGAALGFLGKSLMKGKPENKSTTPSTETPQGLAGNTSVESREQIKKREKLSDMSDGTVLKTKIRQLDQMSNGYVALDVNMEVKSDDQGRKYVEATSQTGDKVTGYLFAKTGKGNTDADFSQGVIQENTSHVIVNGQNQLPIDIISFETVPPGQAVNQPAPTEPVAESIEPEALESVDDEDESPETTETIEPNDKVTDIVVAEKGIEHQPTSEDSGIEDLGETKEENKDTVPSKEKTKSHGNIIYLKNAEGKQLEIQTKGIKGNKELGIIYNKIAEHYNMKLDDVRNLPKLIKNSNNAPENVERVLTYDLDFTNSGLNFSETKDDTSTPPETNPDSKVEEANVIKLEGKKGSEYMTVKGKDGKTIQVPLFYDDPAQMVKSMQKLSEISDIDGTRQKIGPNDKGEFELRPNIRRQLENIQITEDKKESIVPPTDQEPKDMTETAKQAKNETANDGLDDTESSKNKPKQIDNAFENGGAVSVSKIFDKIKSTIDNVTKRSDYTVLKYKYENQLESINHQKEGDALISMERFHKIGTISKLYDKLPEAIQKLAKTMETSEEFAKQKLETRSSDPVNGVKGVGAEGAGRFNQSLSVLLALEKLENTGDEAFKQGKNWFGVDGVANGKSLEGQIAYSMGQTAFEKLKPNTEVWNYVFDQAKIILDKWQKDGNNRHIDLDKLKNGDLSDLTKLPPLVQEEFGKIVAEVLTGKSIYSQIQKPEN